MNNRKNTVAMRRPVLGMGWKIPLYQKLPEFNTAVRGHIQDVYHYALFESTIEALGTKVERMDAYSDKGVFATSSIFSRDFAVVLEDKRIILVPELRKDIQNASKSLKELAARYHYEICEVKETYFEGGNVIYAQGKQVLLHGSNPRGKYLSHSPGYTESQYLIPISEIEANLTSTLESLGVKLISVQLSDHILKGDNPHHIHFYHLDVFMQYVPGDKPENDRLLILNKEIISPKSRQQLEKIFGKNFIDLKYDEYLTQPCWMNMIAVQGEEGIKFVSCQLPDKVIAALKQHNIDVITPDILNSKSSRFDANFAEKVAKNVSEKGYVAVGSHKLCSTIPKNQNAFFYDIGEKIPDFFINQSKVPVPKIDFIIGEGGPHCMTLDISPQESLDRGDEKKANIAADFSQNSSTLFGKAKYQTWVPKNPQNGVSSFSRCFRRVFGC